ncbi:MAG TPA: DUF2339 domain-containing protein [Bryobacteraceae bacterium]|nr:DUF2339 domain-containing protein [Bryobacteraceae bacterium]
MPAPPEERDERLEILSEALAQVVRRQRELEQRIRALESPGAPEPEIALPPLPPPLPQGDPPPPDHDSPIPPPIAAAGAPPDTTLETTFGLNWINRIAVLTLLLGAAFLFKYGVDNDWFGPGARIALGVAASALALFAGDRLWRRGQAVFAQGMIGLGLALLYLSVYAAAMLYQFLPPGIAFVVLCGVTAGAAGLALLYDSQAIAALAMIGGYLTPPALSTGEDHPWILLSYVFVLNLGGLVLARKRRWRAIEPIAACATLLLYAGWFSRWFSQANRVPATIFAVAYYAQFSVATVSGLWAIAQIGASIALALIWRDHAQFAWWNLLLVAGGLSTAARRSWTAAPVWTLACYWLPLWLWYSPDASFAALSLVFAVFFAWTSSRPADLALVPANAALYYAASYSLLNAAHHPYMGLLAVAVGGVHLLLARRLESGSDAQTLAVGVALAFITLAVPIQFAGFRITIAWALEGAVLAWLSARSQNDWLRAGCWGVLALATLRLFALDISIYSRSSEYGVLWNARFLTFAVTTASLWLTARFLAQSVQAAVAYIAGHAVLLFALSLEIGGWVNRNVVPENQSGVQIIAVSVMLTLYAVILVIIGVRTRAAIHRILGLALVVFVVAKLYLVDVWVLGRLFRITAFLALGVLLLALSYLYSRFKPTLARLLKTDATRVH